MINLSRIRLLNDVDHCSGLFLRRTGRESSKSPRGKADSHLILLKAIGTLFRIAVLFAAARSFMAPPVAWTQTWQAGFDFRGTAGYVTDPPGDHPVLYSNTMYPTTSNGVTYGWTSTGNNQLAGWDRNASVDPRLAGMNAVLNSVPPAVFEVDLPSPGVYDVSLGIGDSGNFAMCTVECQVELRDGSNSLFVLTVTGGLPLATFADANG